MRWPRSAVSPASKASCRRSSLHTHFITRASWPGRWGRVDGFSSACPAVETRTWIRSKAPRSPRLRRDFAGDPVTMVAETQSRLELAVRATGDLKLIAYIMAGHPTKQKSIEVGKRLATSGIAALEIGIPFSDPLADGPVIQRAGQIALEQGMTVGASLELAAAIAREGIPIV